ncbi:MAG: flagellar motor protein [Myxococcota bacterium]
MPGRSPDALFGGRLLPGRHRAKVDARWLAEGAVVTPAGATFELPMGGLVIVDFAVRPPEAAARPPAFAESGAPPGLRDGQVQYPLALEAPEGRELRVRGVPMEDGKALIGLEPGRNEVVVSTAIPGTLHLFLHAVDVVRRPSSTLVVPRDLRPAGSVTVDTQGLLRAQLPPGSTLELDGRPVQLDGTGRGAQQTTAHTLTLAIRLPGVTVWTEVLERPGPRGVFAVGLLDVEAAYDVRAGAFQVFGRGAGALRARLAGFDLSGELDFRDSDLEAIRTGNAPALLLARRQDVFARQLDPSRVPLAWADDAATVATNPGEGRFRVEVAREGWGKAGYGDARLFFSDAEVGRAHRAVQGGFVALTVPSFGTPFRAALNGVAAPNQADAALGLARRPAHERFDATGGSLFFLGHASVVQGSEVLRVEWRDPVTGVPMRDLHLTRNLDYSVDALSGRVLLTRPLSFVAQESLLATDPLSASASPVLVVDYEYLDSSAGGATLGGEVRLTGGPVTLSAGALRDGAYDLLRAKAEATLGPVWLSAEGARSRGVIAGLGVSSDGGLSMLSRAAPADTPDGYALTVRARSRGLFGKGAWDAAWRWRQSGYEDISGVGALSTLSLRGEQPLGPVVVTVQASLFDTPDPRDPFSGARLVGRSIGGGVGFERHRWGVRLEARDLESQRVDPLATPSSSTGAFSLGVAGRYRVTDWLQLRAGYRQRLVPHGVDLNDTFASLGVDLKPTDALELNLRGGWGPAVGALAWGSVSYSRGRETWYGLQSMDVDAPSTGERRLVAGVREQLDPATAVFVEDISATDVDGLRLARAVGVSQRLGDAFTITGRYEHGARSTVGAAPDVARDAGGLTFAWDSERVRLYGRGELRADQGPAPLTQWLATGGGEVRLHRDVTGAARVLFSHGTRSGRIESRLLDASASVAWRFAVGAVVARYTYQQELRGLSERRLHLVSLLPAAKLTDRFALGAGGHLALTPEGAVLSASLRPSVRIVAGLEFAVEGALRTSNPGGGSLSSLRGEVGYRLDDRFYVGAGYTAFGFSGTGLENGASGSRDRLYLRTEVAY